MTEENPQAEDRVRCGTFTATYTTSLVADFVDMNDGGKISVILSGDFLHLLGHMDMLRDEIARVVDSLMDKGA